MDFLIKRHWRLPLLAAALLIGFNPGSDAQSADSLRQLKMEILSSPSATQTLTAHCARLHLADPPLIRAVRDTGTDRAASPAVRRLLQVGAGEPVRYRRVRLACGDQVLSDADNWYVPARLTAEMNKALDETDTPFGAVVKPLDFRRRTLKAQAAHDRVHVLEVTALLVTAQGMPFSLVQENYSRILLRHGYP